MSDADHSHSSRLHGEALLAAQRGDLQPLIDHLAEQAAGRDDVRVECAGLIAGWWFASPATQQGYELIAVGLLLLAGPGRRRPAGALGADRLRAADRLDRVLRPQPLTHRPTDPLRHSAAFTRTPR